MQEVFNYARYLAYGMDLVINIFVEIYNLVFSTQP